MAVAASLLKIYRTAVHVTEPWCIEAESAEEARKLRSAGADRCEIGDCANIEVERVEDRAVARPEPQRSACALPF